MRVVVVGATGLVGGQVVDELLKSGVSVQAIVRDPERAKPLAERGVVLHRGDLKDAGSLRRALDEIGSGLDALITTAYGYSRRQKGDSLSSVDDIGNQNLISAAEAAGVKRFVFTSVLTADKAVSVPHFHQKARTEDVLAASGLDWIALRPGGFLDTLLEFNIDNLRKGRLIVPSDHEAPASTILSRDVARCLAEAATKGNSGERVDLGMDRPTNIIEIAALLSKALGREIVPSRPPGLIMSVMGLFSPAMRETMVAMKYVSTGQYVADVTRQTELFGPPRTLEASVDAWVESNAGALQQ
ncbi:MAG: SDR family oxidoreductase [Pseudomonadota bacterium]